MTFFKDLISNAKLMVFMFAQNKREPTSNFTKIFISYGTRHRLKDLLNSYNIFSFFKDTITNLMIYVHFNYQIRIFFSFFYINFRMQSSPEIINKIINL